MFVKYVKDIKHQGHIIVDNVTGPLPGVADVLSEWGSLYISTSENTLYHFQEKDTQTKLEILFKKNLYAVAIDLAKNQHYSDGLMDIFTQYGNHLYSKGDHDGAMKQYIATIGHLELYVIRKFLDAQRILNLTAYLQALHEQNLANTDHTTLLLNCYTKLKDVKKLDEFIMTDKELHFDVETAIKVCRQASYYNHALYLAEKFQQNDWYLKIQLEDKKDYLKALDYIGKLEFAAVRAKSSSMVCSTLLELYLNKAKHCEDKMDQVEPESKALALLQNVEGKYEIENDHAMVLAQMHNLKAGILLLYEKSKLFPQILRYHMEHDEHANVIETCRNYGSQDPSLWVQALSYFAGKEENCKGYIMEVLTHIDKHNLLPPLLVLQTLAHNSTATLAVVKDYIVKRLQHEDDQIAQCNSLSVIQVQPLFQAP